MLSSSVQDPGPHVFHWKGRRWDVARLADDIAAGAVAPARISLGRPFIEAYASQVLGQHRDHPPVLGEPPRLSLWVAVDAIAALALPAAALQSPLLVLEIEEGQGLFRLPGGSGCNHVLGDGQHRLTKAFFEDVAELSAFLVDRSASARYLL
jgi:hypothetical protein